MLGSSSSTRRRRKQLSNHPRGTSARRRRTKRRNGRALTAFVSLLVCLLGAIILLAMAFAVSMVLRPQTSTKEIIATTTDTMKRSNTTSISSEETTARLRRRRRQQRQRHSHNLRASSATTTIGAKNTTTMNDETSSQSPPPIIHIVNTRFMQHQGHLVTLGKARLYLFQTFCLPTMVHQTTQNFLWIIKTDPQLDLTIRNDLIDILKPYPNYYLVASNVNFGSEQLQTQQTQSVNNNNSTSTNNTVVIGSWRNGMEGNDILQSTIHTGNIQKLQQAHGMRNHRDVRIILETRLDADDGLHTRYIQYVQTSALSKLVRVQQPQPDVDDDNYKKQPQPSQLKWMYWCSKRHVQWYASSPSTTKPEGFINPIEHSHLCVTPGITFGVSVGSVDGNVLDKNDSDDNVPPQYDHDVLYKTIAANGGCHYDDDDDNKKNKNDKKNKRNLDCIQLVDDLSFVAVRSRTPTSAGMMDVELSQELDDGNGHNNVPLIWKLLTGKAFHISRQQVIQTNEYIHAHIQQIAKDNLEGQCTRGHSCKNSSIVLLHKLMATSTSDGDGGTHTHADEDDDDKNEIDDESN